MVTPYILLHSSLAQSVEHLTVNQGVTGSSPVGGAILKTTFVYHDKSGFLLLYGQK